jgi:hypothetical protein
VRPPRHAAIVLQDAFVEYDSDPKELFQNHSGSR